MRSVALEYGLSETAVRRHRDAHLSPALTTAVAERGHRHVQSLADRVEALLGEAEDLLHEAKASGTVPMALAAIRECRGVLDLLGRATGELKPDGPSIVVNLATSTEWLAIRAAVMKALEAHPEARRDVAAALAPMAQAERPALPVGR